MKLPWQVPSRRCGPTIAAKPEHGRAAPPSPPPPLSLWTDCSKQGVALYLAQPHALPPRGVEGIP